MRKIMMVVMLFILPVMAIAGWRDIDQVEGCQTYVMSGDTLYILHHESAIDNIEIVSVISDVYGNSIDITKKGAIEMWLFGVRSLQKYTTPTIIEELPDRIKWLTISVVVFIKTSVYYGGDYTIDVKKYKTYNSREDMALFSGMPMGNMVTLKVVLGHYKQYMSTKLNAVDARNAPVLLRRFGRW